MGLSPSPSCLAQTSTIYIYNDNLINDSLRNSTHVCGEVNACSTLCRCHCLPELPESPPRLCSPTRISYTHTRMPLPNLEKAVTRRNSNKSTYGKVLGDTTRQRQFWLLQETKSGMLSEAAQVARGRLRCLGPREILRGRLRFS